MLKRNKSEFTGLGDGHVFFKHNKMVNTKRQLTKEIYTKNKIKAV